MGACHPEVVVAAALQWLVVAHETRLGVLPDVLGQREVEVAGHLWALPAYPDTNQREAYGPESADVCRWQVVRASVPQVLS